MKVDDVPDRGADDVVAIGPRVRCEALAQHVEGDDAESPGQPVEDRLPVLGAARGDGAVLATMQQDERLAGAGLVVARLDTTSSTEARGLHGGMLPARADAGNRRAATSLSS